MPRKKVRNFWLSGFIDGRATPLKGGPANKEGGFTLVIHQRQEGKVTKVGIVTGTERKGTLTLTMVLTGQPAIRHTTVR
jgi:hypothetical protein